MFSNMPELAKVLSQCLRVCFEEEKTSFATSFYRIDQLTQACSYPQVWDLFFFIFFLFFLYSTVFKPLLFKKNRKG